MPEFAIILLFYWFLPYCIQPHDGIGKENRVILDVCTTEIKKPWRKRMKTLKHIQFP